MITPSVIAMSAQSVAICLEGATDCYSLSAPRAWALFSGDRCVRRDVTTTVAFDIHDLQPDQTYQLEIDGLDRLNFRTKSAAKIISLDELPVLSGDAISDEDAFNNAVMINHAIASLPQGGVLVVPAGIWKTGPLKLKSHMSLHLCEGAVLKAPRRNERWPVLPANDDEGRMVGSWEGEPAACYAALVYAVGATNLAITGKGTLECGGADGDWWQWAKETRNGARRARGLHLIDCETVSLVGFTIRNAPSWTIHPQGCRNINAVCLSIEAPSNSPNTDGFNPESCEAVTMTGIRFSVGDDCIAIKAGKRSASSDNSHLAPTSGILIRHCLMKDGHGGVVIGSEMSGSVSDVRVEFCEMDGTDRGLRMKTRRGRGGKVERISMRNCVLRDVATAFSANGFYHCDADGHDDWVQSRVPAAVDETTPSVCEIEIRDVTLYGVHVAVGAFLGLPERPFGPIRFSNLTVASLRRDGQAGFPVMADDVMAHRGAGILCENCDVTGVPDYLADRSPISIPRRNGMRDTA